MPQNIREYMEILQYSSVYSVRSVRYKSRLYRQLGKGRKFRIFSRIVKKVEIKTVKWPQDENKSSSNIKVAGK